MNWSSLYLIIKTMSPVEAVLSTIIFAFLVYRGYINIPAFLKRKKADAPTDPTDLTGIHRSCVNYSSLLIILERAIKDSDEIIQIKYIETVYDQMNLAEEYWSRIRMQLREAFVSLLDPSLSSKQAQDAKICYNLILDKLGGELLGLIRKWIKRNHFLEKSEIEFKAYIDQRVGDLEEFFSISIQDIYMPSGIQVDIETLRTFNIEQVMPGIAKELADFFMRARAISAEKAAKIASIKSKLPLS